MARSESRSSRGSLRWFIPGGVQRARPKKIEALSREREREGERRERRGRSIRGRDTHTHTQEAERGGQRSFGGALPRGQEGRREGGGERRGLYLEEGAQGRKEDGERRRTIGKNEGAGRRGGKEGRRMEQEINKKKKRRRKNGGVVGGEKPAWLERQVQRAKDATLRGRGYSRNCGWIHRLTPLRFRAASSLHEEWIFLILGRGYLNSLLWISPLLGSTPSQEAWLSLHVVLSKIVIASVEYRVRIEKVLGRSEGKFLAGGMDETPRGVTYDRCCILWNFC